MSDEDDNTETDDNTKTETPELSDEGKEQVEAMRQAYDDDRPTAVLPGTDKTITGVAVNEWLDDDGNPKFGKDEEHKDEQHDDEQHGDEQQADKQHDAAD